MFEQMSQCQNSSPVYSGPSLLLLWWPAPLNRSSAARRRTLSRVAWRSARATRTSSTGAWLRNGVEVVRPITNHISVLVEEFRRLLKNQRRRHAFDDSRIKDVQPVFVQIDADISPRLIGIGELELVPCDEIDVMEGVERRLDAGFLSVLRGGILDRSENIDLPVEGGLKVGGMVICRVDVFRVGIVDDRYRVAIVSLLPAISCFGKH